MRRAHRAAALVTCPRKAKAAKAPVAAPAPGRDPRLPAPGDVLEMVFKGKALRVEETEAGFRYEGRDWRSLTALAFHVTGYGAVSGPAFFGLTKAPRPVPTPPAPTPPARSKATRKGREKGS